MLERKTNARSLHVLVSRVIIYITSWRGVEWDSSDSLEERGAACGAILGKLSTKINNQFTDYAKHAINFPLASECEN